MSARARLAAAMMAGALLVTARTAGTSSQKATFSTRVEAVRVDVLVTGDAGPVPGLTAADFEVRDNGELEQVQVASFEQLPVSVLLALDASNSVAGARLAQLVEACQAVIARLRKGDSVRPPDRAALLTFNNRLRLDVDFTDDTEKLGAATARVTGESSTALFDAASASLVLGTSQRGRTLAILFTDGEDNASWLTADEVIGEARRSDMVVYGVTVAEIGRRPGGTRQFLEKMADATGGRLFDASSSRDLKALFLAILDEFQQRYLLSYYPRAAASTGWHRLDVRVKGRSVKVIARPGYVVGRSSTSADR